MSKENPVINNPITLTKWVNEPSFNDLYSDYQAAQDDHGILVSKLDIRKENMEGGAILNVPKGKSKVRPKVIRKQAEWKYPALEEPFLNTINMFEVNPRTHEDIHSSTQNALLLNYQWEVQIDKIELVGDAVRTFYDEGTVIIKTGWESEEAEIEVEKEFPIYATPEESMMILQQAVESGSMDPAQAEAMIQSGEPVQTGTEKIMVPEMVLIKNQPTYEVCDNRNVILDPTANGVQADLNFIIHEYETDMSSLKKQEYSVEKEVDEETGEETVTESGIYKNLNKVTYSASTDEREYYNDTEDTETEFEFKDKPRQKLRAYEYWGYWDIHNSGEVTPIIATWVGKVMIRMEENPLPFSELPFSFAKYMPVKNEMNGESDGDLLIENQESIGKMTRAAHDITSVHAVGQTFIDDQFFSGPSQKDNYKSGKTVYYRHGMDPRTSIHKQTVDQVPKSVFDMIQLQNADAESITGTKSFSQGIGSQALGSVATGIRSALDATSKRELSILRRLSSLFKDLGGKTIQMNQAYLDEEQVIRITNDEYVTIKRHEIAGEFDLIVDVSTPEKDNETAEKLNMMMQTNAASMHPGMSKIIYAKIAKLWKQPDLVHEIENFEPEPDPMEEQIKQIRLENEMLKNQKIKMEMAQMAKNIESEDSKIEERDSRTAQNLDTESKENIATARLKNAQAAKIEEETDLLAQNFLDIQDGTKRKEFKEDKEFDRLWKGEQDDAKHIRDMEMKDTDFLDREEEFNRQAILDKENGINKNKGI